MLVVLVLSVSLLTGVLIIITHFSTGYSIGPTGKTAKQGASKVGNKRSKDSTVKSLSKQDVGKSRTKNKVSNGLSSIWERKLFVLSGNSTSEVKEKRSAHITAPVWLKRSSCTYMSIYSGAIHIPTYLLGEGAGEHLVHLWPWKAEWTLTENCLKG